MGNTYSQIFPPAPTFTETSLQSLSGKVYIVTGASAGVGKELARLLYSLNATVYLAARSSEKTSAAISWMQEKHPNSTGKLIFLRLDLNDLSGIKPAAQEFLSKESRLDVLWNNAGVMIPPQGSMTKQGYDLQMGTNCIAPFLFTKLLTPLMLETAKTAEKGSVRVVWVSSLAAHILALRGGLDMQVVGDGKMAKVGVQDKYAISKGGNVLHATEYAKRFGDQGIVSVALNPGNLDSELQRHAGFFFKLMIGWMLHPPVYGAYTEFFAGLSPEVAKIGKDDWIVPWGRIIPLRKDNKRGETAEKFWEWSEKQVEQYV